MSIPDLLELLALPAYDGTRTFLVGTLVSLLDAAVQLQNANGMWHTLLDDPTSYVEASATAGFAYGLLKSVRMRLVSQEKAKVYAEAGHRAVQAILERITPQGELTEVQGLGVVMLGQRLTVPSVTGVVWYPSVQRPGWISQDSADEHAVWPELGAARADRVLPHALVIVSK